MTIRNARAGDPQPVHSCVCGSVRDRVGPLVRGNRLPDRRTEGQPGSSQWVMKNLLTVLTAFASVA